MNTKREGFYLWVDKKNTLSNEVKKAVKKREKLKKEIMQYRQEVEEHTKRVQEIEQAHASLHAEFEKTNQFINDNLLEEAFTLCIDTEMPKEFTIKQDNIWCSIVDFYEKAKAEAQEAKEAWRKHIQTRKEKKE